MAPVAFVIFPTFSVLSSFLLFSALWKFCKSIFTSQFPPWSPLCMGIPQIILCFHSLQHGLWLLPCKGATIQRLPCCFREGQTSSLEMLNTRNIKKCTDHPTVRRASGTCCVHTIAHSQLIEGAGMSKKCCSPSSLSSYLKCTHLWKHKDTSIVPAKDVTDLWSGHTLQKKVCWEPRLEFMWPTSPLEPEGPCVISRPVVSCCGSWRKAGSWWTEPWIR